MIQFIYIIMIFAWALIFYGFKEKSFPIVAISGLFLMIIGLYLAQNPLPNSDDLLNLAVLSLHIGLGAYISIRSGIELTKK